jgi:hypothetical protein
MNPIPVTLDGERFAFPDGVVLEAQYEFSPIAQEMTTLLTGALLVEESSLLAGRPIVVMTGRVGDGYCGLYTAEEVKALQDLLCLPATEFTLAIGDDSHTVIFDRRQKGLEVTELVPVAAGFSWGPSDRMYQVTARFITTDSV